MRDDGLFCRKAEYSREGFGPPHARKKCVKKYGKHNCEQQAIVWYPNCKPGYVSIGPLCRPRHTPDCRALGLKPGLDLSCAKRVIIGKPRTGVCRSGEEKDAGLCYKACRPGYDGVGPVCWSGAPRGWVNCGMGAAKESFTCGHVVFDQVSSVGQMAMFVSSLGSSAAANEGANAATNATRLAELKRKYAQLKEEYEKVKPTIDKLNKAKKAGGAASNTVQLVSEDTATPEDIARVAAQIAAIVDPTGAASTVAAYTYPKCSEYGLQQKAMSPSAPKQPAQPHQAPPPPPTTPGYPRGPAAPEQHQYRPAPTARSSEQQCYDMVQGHVAWDRAGHRGWSPNNLRMLCQGATHPQRRIACFESRIGAGENWSRAINECKNPSAPRPQPHNAPTGVVRAAPAHPQYRPAPPARNPEQQCYDMVQGHVAWDRAGHRSWSPNNLRMLCQGATHPQRRIACFESRIRAGENWSRATNECRNK